MLLLRFYGHLDEGRQVKDSLISDEKIGKEGTGKSRLETMNLHCLIFSKGQIKKVRYKSCKCSLLKSGRKYMENLYIFKFQETFGYLYISGDNWIFFKEILASFFCIWKVIKLRTC